MQRIARIAFALLLIAGGVAVAATAPPVSTGEVPEPVGPACGVAASTVQAVHAPPANVCNGCGDLGSVEQAPIYVSSKTKPNTKSKSKSKSKAKEKPKKRACIPASECCKICRKGQACGNSCISARYTCHKGSGCACNEADVC